MSELSPDHTDRRTPFVLGTPIKNPADFYGRRQVLQDLFRIVLDQQLATVVGEHRCGNTSVLYQLLHPDVRAKYLRPEADHRLLFAFVSAQLGSESPEAFLRRIARSLRRHDPDARVDFDAKEDQAWLENYLEDLADRGKRLVLLVDEFEVLGHFEPGFWEWFQTLVLEYDVSVIASTRMDLGQYRTETGAGSAFFNLFRSIYIGSFRSEVVDEYLADTTQLTEFNLVAIKDEITALAGRFPYYLQVASTLFYTQFGGAAEIKPAEVEEVHREFRLRTEALLDDAWRKLPAIEREALTWLALGLQPERPDAVEFGHAVRLLERRGYVVDGRIFSSAMVDHMHHMLRRVGPSVTPGAVRVGRQLVQLPPKELALLHLFLEHAGQVTTSAQIGTTVWPEFGREVAGVSEAIIRQTVEHLRRAIEPEDASVAHIENLPGENFLFNNPRLEDTATTDG